MKGLKDNTKKIFKIKTLKITACNLYKNVFPDISEKLKYEPGYPYLNY